MLVYMDGTGFIKIALGLDEAVDGMDTVGSRRSDVWVGEGVWVDGVCVARDKGLMGSFPWSSGQAVTRGVGELNAVARAP